MARSILAAPWARTSEDGGFHPLYLILKDETQMLDKVKTREALLEKAAKGLAGRLSPYDLRRLITAGRASKTPKDWNGWLNRVITNNTWDEELKALR